MFFANKTAFKSDRAADKVKGFSIVGRRVKQHLLSYNRYVLTHKGTGQRRCTLYSCIFFPPEGSIKTTARTSENAYRGVVSVTPPPHEQEDEFFGFKICFADINNPCSSHEQRANLPMEVRGSEVRVEG